MDHRPRLNERVQGRGLARLEQQPGPITLAQPSWRPGYGLLGATSWYTTHPASTSVSSGGRGACLPLRAVAAAGGRAACPREGRAARYLGFG